VGWPNNIAFKPILLATGLSLHIAAVMPVTGTVSAAWCSTQSLHYLWNVQCTTLLWCL